MSFEFVCCIIGEPFKVTDVVVQYISVFVMNDCRWYYVLLSPEIPYPVT